MAIRSTLNARSVPRFNRVKSGAPSVGAGAPRGLYSKAIPSVDIRRMCGIFGIAAVRGERPSLDDAGVIRLRDVLAHRGPDGAGLWRRENVVLAHRRLAVIDPTEAGAQPMGLTDTGRLLSTGWKPVPPASEEARFTIVYNGELYNDAEIRAALIERGTRFETRCDTETVIRSWSMWGPGSLEKLRGMFAFAVYDAKLETLTLARDALGVKPLYFWVGPREIVFASELRAIVAHPHVASAPNPRMVSAYLTTIRTVLGNETLYQGVYAVRPGQMLQADVGARSRIGDPPMIRLVDWWRGPTITEREADMEDTARRIRSVVADSVRRQMRSDVPVCALLSGGLDSTIIAALARRDAPELKTFCAGAVLPASCSEDPSASDITWARRAAASVATDHDEAPITRELFLERWAWMVRQMASPLSTPNEVAIYEVARRLRERGCIVTLSGEGADELFAGYEGPLDMAARYLASHAEGPPGAFELAAHAWVPIDFKPGVLSERAWRAAEHDRWLEQMYHDEFAWSAGECGEEGLAAHLRLHRRINLTGLLQRLDTATMLAGVEGRTPFADALVAAEAEALPMSLKYQEVEGERAGWKPAPPVGSRSATLLQRRTKTRTKIVLREAFADLVPRDVLERPKASFPLPFQAWMKEATAPLERSALAREIFTPAAIKAVVEKPEQLWNLAWPMINLAMWGESLTDLRCD